MIQEQRVLEYMKKHDGITDLEATFHLGVRRLSAKIYNLKKQGYVIKDEWKKGINRYGEKTRFKVYMLSEESL